MEETYKDRLTIIEDNQVLKEFEYIFIDISPGRNLKELYIYPLI